MPFTRSSKVCILLSSFNGAKYIAEQLDSLLAQNYPNIKIYVRDDGSSDNTNEILKSYQNRHPSIILETENNIGAVASFYDLLSKADTDADFFAFCDQDDIWLPDKISRAVSILETSQAPAKSVYFSKVALVSEELKQIGVTPSPQSICFENALVENVMTGATCVFGSDIRKLFLEAKSEYMIWHDWWLYLLATSMGDAVYDETPFLLSRRHSSNQTGLRGKHESLLQKLAILKRVFNRKRKVSIFQQAVFFANCYSIKHPNHISSLDVMLKLNRQRSLKNLLLFTFHPSLRMNRWLDNLAMKLLTVLGYSV